MMTPAKMRSANDWAEYAHGRSAAIPVALASTDLIRAIQSDAIAFTEARVAALVRAQVVEECAKVCDEAVRYLYDVCPGRISSYWTDEDRGSERALEWAAEAIRALAAKPVSTDGAA